MFIELYIGSLVFCLASNVALAYQLSKGMVERGYKFNKERLMEYERNKQTREQRLLKNIIVFVPVVNVISTLNKIYQYNKNVDTYFKELKTVGAVEQDDTIINEAKKALDAVEKELLLLKELERPVAQDELYLLEVVINHIKKQYDCGTIKEQILHCENLIKELKQKIDFASQNHSLNQFDNHQKDQPISKKDENKTEEQGNSRIRRK